MHGRREWNLTGSEDEAWEIVTFLNKRGYQCEFSRKAGTIQDEAELIKFLTADSNETATYAMVAWPREDNMGEPK